MINRPEDHRYMVALQIGFLALDIPVRALLARFFLLGGLARYHPLTGWTESQICAS